MKKHISRFNTYILSISIFLLVLIMFLALFNSSKPTEQFATAIVTVYLDKNFQQTKWTNNQWLGKNNTAKYKAYTSDGEYYLSGVLYPSTNIKGVGSIKIAKGYKVTFYRNEQPTSPMVLKSGDYSDLSNANLEANSQLFMNDTHRIYIEKDTGDTPTQQYVSTPTVSPASSSSSSSCKQIRQDPPTDNVVTLFDGCEYTGLYASFTTNGRTKSLAVSPYFFNDKARSVEVKSGYKVRLYEDYNFQGNFIELTSNTNLADVNFDKKASSLIIYKL